METCWSSATARLVLLAAAAVLCAEPAAAKGKRERHPAGFSFEVPGGWSFENGESGAMLVPPGVKVDPDREDNPEIYTVWGAVEGGSAADEDLVKNIRESLGAQGLQAEGKRENFGRRGAIHTFDFDHPQRKAPFRVRIYLMQAKGRPIALIATGLRARLQSRDGTLREIAASLDYDR